MLEVVIVARGATEEALNEAVQQAAKQLDWGLNKGIGTQRDLAGSYEYHLKGYEACGAWCVRTYGRHPGTGHDESCSCWSCQQIWPITK